MFGGGNDNAAAQPADHQGMPADGALTDTSTNGMMPSDPSATAYDTNGYAVSGGDASGVVSPTAPAADTEATLPQPVAADPVGAAPAVSDDLLGLKQQALQQLSPLVGHLDQTPEEKFRTTMMMIQASDNSDLIKEAYAAAQQIPDEKVRAQALLDVINEINYFTQHHEQQS